MTQIKIKRVYEDPEAEDWLPRIVDRLMASRHEKRISEI